jgi:hypothetical protein
MRRLLGWVGGAVGGITAYRFLRRKHAAELPAAPGASLEADARAEELRAKLAESRVGEPPVAEEQLGEPEPEQGPDEPEQESPEDRRRRVYEEGRAALDEMQPDAEADQ